jgi:hypothetical protein
MVALVRHPLIDEILDARRDYARGQHASFEGYAAKAGRRQAVNGPDLPFPSDVMPFSPA